MFWDKAMRYDTITLEERWTAIASGKVSDNSRKLLYFIDYLLSKYVVYIEACQVHYVFVQFSMVFLGT